MNNSNLGSLWKRVGGAAIDFAIVMVIAAIVIFAWAAYIGASQSEIGLDRNIQKEIWKGRGLIVGLGLDLLYSVLLQGSSRQRTFGQQVFSLKLTRLNGETVTYPRAAARYFVSLISSIVIKLGFLNAVFSKNKQTFHDLVAGTVVIDIAKVKKQNFEGVEKSLSVDDRTWEIASLELNGGNRFEGIWARAFAEADGDEAKAKARYLKMRVEQIQLLNATTQETVRTLADASDSKARSGHKSIIAIMLGIVILLIGYLVYNNSNIKSLLDSINFHKDPALQSSQSSTSVDITSARDIDSAKQKDKPVTSLPEPCKVYWDGTKWNLGKTEGDRFTKYSRAFEGVEMLEFAIPKEMAKALNAEGKIGQDIDSKKFDTFLNTYWYQIDILCNFHFK